MIEPVINIITRTRNRPKYFGMCAGSIKAQTYSNIHHVVTYQVDEDLEYINYHKIPNTTTIKVPNLTKDMDLSTYKDNIHITHAPYNTFFNTAHKHIKEGWVMYVDDDDMLTYANSIELLVSEIQKHDTDTKHMWKVQFPGYHIPADDWFKEYQNNKPLQCGQISGIGVLFHSSNIDKVIWHEWACGDYFAFKGLEETHPKRNMINATLTRLQTQPGKGLTQDA